MTSRNAKYARDYLIRHGNPNGRVVEIINVLTGDNYIGHTTNPATKLLYQLRAASKTERKGLLFDNMREWGTSNFEVRTIHECNKDEDVVIKMREYINMLCPTLNKI